MRTRIAIVFWACSGASQAQWMQLTDFAGTPRDDAAAFAIGDQVYVGTGMEVGWGLANDWYRFDGSTDQWSAVASLPATPRQYCSAFVIYSDPEAYGYLFGGLDANGPLNELWRYEPASDSWTQMASLPGAPRYAAVAFEGGYVATGLIAGGSATNELWHYDVGTDTWEQLASMPGTPRHRACGADWSGLMVIGGADADYNALTDCWSYNAISDTWTACAPLPEGRYGAMCGLAAYDLLLIGGATNASTIVETALSYNVSSWSPWDEPHPGGTRRGGVMVLAGSSIPGVWHTYIGLGLSNDLTRHKDWYRISGAFGIEERQWGDLVLFPNPTTDHITTVVTGPSARASIVDASGKIISTHLLKPKEAVSLLHLEAGAYSLIVEQNGARRTGHFIKLP